MRNTLFAICFSLDFTALVFFILAAIRCYKAYRELEHEREELDYKQLTLDKFTEDAYQQKMSYEARIRDIEDLRQDLINACRQEKYLAESNQKYNKLETFDDRG